jgi:hypothetical protein
MGYKPEDFFVGVIDFFSVCCPVPYSVSRHLASHVAMSLVGRCLRFGVKQRVG